MILISQGENAAPVMEGDVSCGWGEPLNPEQLDQSLTVLLRHRKVQGRRCVLYRKDPLVSIRSHRAGWG